MFKLMSSPRFLRAVVWFDASTGVVLGALHLPWEISADYLDCRLEADELEAEVSRLEALASSKTEAVAA